VGGGLSGTAGGDCGAGGAVIGAVWASGVAIDAGNYLYHLALCGKKREVVAVWHKHLLEARYFNESDMLNLPLLEEPKELLEYRVREFLMEIRPAMVAGYAVLEQLPIDDAYNQQEYGFSRGELDRSVQICLAEVEKLEGLAKFSGLLCLAQRATEAKRLECLKQAQDMAEELLEDESLEFASNLFLYKLGNGFHELKAYEEAIASYDTAIGIKPYHCDAWNNRGVSLAALGRREEAIVSYEKAIEIKFDKHEAWNNRGVSLDDLGRREEAIASYDKAIEFKPDLHEAWYGRGISLAALAHRKEAIASYEKAIEFKPDDATAFYNRACCHSLMGNLEMALEDLTTSFRLDPEKYRQLATTDTDLDPLRSDRAFIALMESII
jgi:tetratricopeptide (TPR) repeat protein